MSRHVVAIVFIVSTAAAACHKDKSNQSSDLNLTSQPDSAAIFDSISAAEHRNGSTQDKAGARGESEGRSSARTAGSTESERTHRSHAASSAGEVGQTAPAAPQTVVKKNTKRDAAIGAGAGAIIGGATHGLKGGVVGAVVGGVVGGVIGNNVDKKKKKAP